MGGCVHKAFSCSLTKSERQAAVTLSLRLAGAGRCKQSTLSHSQPKTTFCLTLSPKPKQELRQGTLLLYCWNLWAAAFKSFSLTAYSEAREQALHVILSSCLVNASRLDRSQSLKHRTILILNVKLCIFLFREFLAFFLFKEPLNSGNSSNEKQTFLYKV